MFHLGNSLFKSNTSPMGLVFQLNAKHTHLYILHRTSQMLLKEDI